MSLKTEEKTSCIIIDDDEIMQTVLQKMVAKTNFLQLDGTFTHASEALDYLLEHSPGIVFLDIMMPEFSGIDLLKNLKKSESRFVLISSEKGYGPEAFDFNVSDYILKPVSYERFLKAVERARGELDKRSPENHDHALFVKSNGRFVRIPFDEIYVVEALADYVTINTPLKKYIVHSTMKGILDKLPQGEFLRIHNSFIVRLDKITEMEDNTITINNKVLPVSRANVPTLKNALNIL